ncbi:hypothetical protein Sdia_50090 [Streptomyces diastaticus subsp. diastaticus]|uniref:Uncharacterized protein n=1 Tax=Streptomyces diastaticus subsp. diastaticus TaxID=68040 RepID=A0ABQ1CVA0_STRDI|nr:hypothetical protein Sdia_50090 [Streptomyces diastaticus subsp. diastaticus]GGU38817.1 hypothetical protein GCM10015534_46750 [Streptomyces diastaticus subsp. diastaticus]
MRRSAERTGRAPWEAGVRAAAPGADGRPAGSSCGWAPVGPAVVERGFGRSGHEGAGLPRGLPHGTATGRTTRRFPGRARAARGARTSRRGRDAQKSTLMNSPTSSKPTRWYEARAGLLKSLT